MLLAVRVFFLYVWLLVSAAFTAEMIYHSRQAAEIRPEYAGRIWALGILGIMGPIGLILLVWLPPFVPQLERWSTLICMMAGIGGIAALTHRVILHRILRPPWQDPDYIWNLPILAAIMSLLLLCGVALSLIVFYFYR